MKFKNILATTALVLPMFFISSCKEAEVSLKMEPVGNLLGPENNISVPLQSAADASLFFEWSEVSLPDASIVMYEVVFDKPDGDFSNPVFRILSDNNGLRPYVSITHKQLNKAGASAGIEAGATGEMIWTVVASKGISEKVCTESRKIEVTRLSGFADVPAEVFIDGEATEFENERALSAKSEEGEFEIFTRLESGKQFNFTDGNGRIFYPSNGSLLEGSETATVNETGVYKISLDFYSGISIFKKVESVRWHHCDSDCDNLELPYSGDGIWSAKKLVMKEEYFNGTKIQTTNPRYRFYMKYADGSTSVMGPMNAKENAMPGDNPDPSYFYTAEYSSNYDQFNPKWKRNKANTVTWIGDVYNISLILQPGSHYTHELTEASADEPEPPVQDETGEMFLTGDGTEGGNTLSSALKMKALDNKDFEIFTKLEADKNFCLATTNTGTPATYSIADGKVTAGGTSKVPESGVYKISVNMETKTASVKRILAVKWYHCNSAVSNVEIPYTGNGIWELKGHTFTDEDVPGKDKPEADKKNPRYRFLIEYEDDSTTVLGPVDISQDAAPTEDSPVSYYYCREYTKEEILKTYSESQFQYNPKWKRMGGQITWVGDNYDIRLELTATDYTHKLTKN